MDLLPENLIFFGFKWFFKGWGVANHKLSNCSTSNDNPHEPLVINILNPYLGEKDYYT